MPIDPVLKLTDLQRRYAGRLVVDVPGLEIRGGELLAIVGPSGSGKSTLLRLLGGLETPDQGRIFYRDRPTVPPLPLAIRRETTMVFQHPRLLSRSVSDNVGIGLRLRGIGRDAAKTRIDAMLKQVGLEALAEAPAQRLSGGEKQRVALARALVFEPTVLLLDEPTANLDPHNVSLIEDLISRERRQRPLTIVLVTHNVFQARRLADRCALLLGGRLVEVSDTESFFQSPADARVTAFVRGEMVY